jgi:hypothetical protein
VGAARAGEATQEGGAARAGGATQERGAVWARGRGAGSCVGRGSALGTAARSVAVQARELAAAVRIYRIALQHQQFAPLAYG